VGEQNALVGDQLELDNSTGANFNAHNNAQSMCLCVQGGRTSMKKKTYFIIGYEGLF